MISYSLWIKTSPYSCIMHIYLKVYEKEETEKTNGAKGKTVGCVMKTGCC